jgi:hypothetical protein
MANWELWKRPPNRDVSLTSLTFTDVIFGLVFTQIFIRAAALNSLSTAVDVHLALSLAVAAGSYIGYRGSLKRGSYKLAFFNLPLLRFTLDLFMIFLYYVLAVTPDETTNPSALVHARVDSLVVLLIFAAYLVWDLVSLVMSVGAYKEIKFRWSRTWVTIVCLAVAAVVFGIAWTAGSPLSQHLAISVDGVLIAMVILYRWVKDGFLSTPPAAGLRADMDAVSKAVTQLDQNIAAQE